MNRIVRAMCWIMVCVFPLYSFCAERNAAMLNASGAVKVNGTTVPASQAVYPGDQVVTEKKGSVTLVTRGASMLLPANSAIRYGRQVELAYGGVVVNATPVSGVSARLGSLSVSPGGPNARFHMTSTNKKLVLAALEGSLNVTDGTHAMVLRAGQMLSADPEPPGGTTTGGTSPKASGIPGWVVGVVAVGAIAAVGAVVATSGSSKVSPSQP